MTEKVLDRKIGQDQSVPKDLVVWGRIRGNGAVHEHLVPTAKADLQIADIVFAKLHLTRPRFDASLAQNGSPIRTNSASFQTVFGGPNAPSIQVLEQLVKMGSVSVKPVGAVKA